MINNIDEKHFPLAPGARILDVGCASGSNAIALKRAGYRVSAIEIDPNLVKKFRASPDSADIEITLGDATEMPHASNTFDGAILIEVIEHIEATKLLLFEINRVMKPGGILCIGVPTSYTERIYWWLHPGYATNATHVKIFSKKELRLALNQAGFKITNIDSRNLVPAVSWLFHSALRSKSDHTGAIHEHLWVDRWLDSFFRKWGRIPVLNKALRALRRTVGKSWYVYCQKVD